MAASIPNIGLRYDADDAPYSVVIDIDSLVAYAYLLHHEAVISDVWLFNVGDAPAFPEWSQPENAPFRNPIGFASARPVPAQLRPTDVSVQWRYMDGRLLAARILIAGVVAAQLAPNAKPGWSVWALRNGPLARTLGDLLE